MKISIKMDADLSAANEPKIMLVSPMGKQYSLDATTLVYGSKTVLGKSIPVMSIDAETGSAVEIEDGVYQVEATIDYGHFRLNSPVMDIDLKRQLVVEAEEKKIKGKKIKEATGKIITTE